MDPFTIAFIGHTESDAVGQVSAYEDEVLPLLADHGARLVYRGRRVAGQDQALPLEVHLIWFPDRSAFDSYLSDSRRDELLTRYGDVFTTRTVVELENLETAEWPR